MRYILAQLFVEDYGYGDYGIQNWSSPEIFATLEDAEMRRSDIVKEHHDWSRARQSDVKAWIYDVVEELWLGPHESDEWVESGDIEPGGWQYGACIYDEIKKVKSI